MLGLYTTVNIEDVFPVELLKLEDLGVRVPNLRSGFEKI
jgi:hypothetical protein